MPNSFKITDTEHPSSQADLPLPGAWNTRIISLPRGDDGRDDHFAIVFKSELHHEDPIVRIHSECVTGDVFGSLRCDCGPQLQEALALMRQQGGILIYLRQEGRGIGLRKKIEAYSEQARGSDTYLANIIVGCEPDARTFDTAATFLVSSGYRRIRLLSNNPIKRVALEAAGLTVTMQPTGVFENSFNKRYLNAKRDIGLHTIPLAPDTQPGATG